MLRQYRVTDSTRTRTYIGFTSYTRPTNFVDGEYLVLAHWEDAAEPWIVDGPAGLAALARYYAAEHQARPQLCAFNPRNAPQRTT